jgi:hypothetical protein
MIVSSSFAGGNGNDAAHDKPSILSTTQQAGKKDIPQSQYTDH